MLPPGAGYRRNDQIARMDGWMDGRKEIDRVRVSKPETERKHGKKEGWCVVAERKQRKYVVINAVYERYTYVHTPTGTIMGGRGKQKNCCDNKILLELVWW